MKVLGIGEGPKPQAAELFKDAEVLTLDIDPRYNPTYLHDASIVPYDFIADGEFDVVFASHILEHITFWKEQEVLNEWARIVRPGGEVHIAVPSWEWVARNVLAEKPSIGLKHLAFASQQTPWEVHLNMFTMRQLRALFEKAGLGVYWARTGPLVINVGGQLVEVEQHYVAGRKL